MARFTKSSGFWVGASLGTMTAVSLVAAAQTTGSPFANAGQQAWETYDESATQPYVPPTPSAEPFYDQPTSSPYSGPAPNSAPVYEAPTYSAPSQYNAPTQSAPNYSAPMPDGNYSGDYSAPTSPPTSPFAPRTEPNYSNYQAPQGQQDYSYQAPNYQSSYGDYEAPTQTQYYDVPQGVYSPQSYPAPQKQGWLARMGLDRVHFALSGFLRGGVSGTQRDDSVNNNEWSEDYVADGQLRGEASAITQGGVEYGFGAELRAQYDAHRRGFGGLVGSCPPTVAGCGSALVAGTPMAIRGHTSRFYTDNVDDIDEVEVAVEGAYFFLRSAYGDFTVGRDDGAAYLFSLGAPSVVMVNASNSPVDYTGLDSVKTVNDASGFAEKISYVSPRLLGDTIGIGVQLGVSYAPDALACGVDYCVRRNGTGTMVLSPELEHVIEGGLSLDRTFDNGLSIEATATYATASEESGLAEFDDLRAIGAGLEIGMGDFTLGGSYLNSNNGLQKGDYESYDVGLQWKPGRFGASLGYGHATDENARLTSDQGTFGMSYDVTKNFQLGTGVQYIEREISAESGGILGLKTEKATAIFIEGGFKF